MAVDQSERFPFPINWKGRFVETYEYRTEIITSRAGREQRGQLRYRPRRTLAFDVLVRNGQFATFSRLMQGRHHLGFKVAHPIEKTTLTSALNENTDTFTVEAVPGWVDDGATLVLVGPGGTEMVNVQSIFGTTIMLQDPALATWPAGTTLHRAFACRPQNRIRTVSETNDLVRVSMVFEGEPGFVSNANVGTAASLFNGKEIIFLKPNWIEPVSIEYDSNLEKLDYGMGRIGYSTPIDYRTRYYRAVYTGRNLTEAYYISSFFNRQAGQLKEFYMPTWMKEIQHYGAPLVGGLRVEGSEFATTFNGDPVNKCVTVHYNNGVIDFFAVESVTTNGISSFINFANGQTFTQDFARVMFVSWCPTWRFASDRLEVEWLTDQVAQFTLSFRTLEDLPA